MKLVTCATAAVAIFFGASIARAADDAYEHDLTRVSRLRREHRLQARASSSPRSNWVVPAGATFLQCPPTFNSDEGRQIDLLYTEITHSHGDTGTLGCRYPASAEDKKNDIPYCQYDIFTGKDANFWGINDLGCAQTANALSLAFEDCYTSCSGTNLLGVNIYNGGDARITGCLINDELETPCDFNTRDGSVFNTDSELCANVRVAKGTCVVGY